MNMPDSLTSETNMPSREPRFEAVVRWAEHIQENPPEVWGPQQNAVVNAQIDSAATVERTPEDIERIQAFADDVLADDECVTRPNSATWLYFGVTRTIAVSRGSTVIASDPPVSHSVPVQQSHTR